MNWYQITLVCDKTWAEVVAETLENLGAQSTMFQAFDHSEIFETEPGQSSLWHTVKVTALFSPNHNVYTIHSRLKQRLPKGVFRYFKSDYLPDQDWEQIGRELYHPIQCAPDLWICPSWHHPPDPDAHNVIIDPGLAFGTGAHPTTYLCMRWLSDHPPKDAHVLDLGCGSGVLGLAALHLGAARLTAVDHDELALKATRQNAELNNLEHAIDVVTPQAVKDQQFDVVLANILTETLLELLSEVVGYTKPQGIILLSGIMTSEQQKIINSYSQYVDFQKSYEHEGWSCLQFRR